MIEDMFPVPDITTGEDVPTRQIHLILAWLCSIGEIEKKGRDGYQLCTMSLADNELDRIWEDLPSFQIAP